MVEINGSFNGGEDFLCLLSVESGEKVWFEPDLCVCVCVMGRLACVFQAHNGSHVREIVFRQHDCDTDACALKLNRYKHTQIYTFSSFHSKSLWCVIQATAHLGKFTFIDHHTRFHINKTVCSATHKTQGYAQAKPVNSVCAKKWSVYETFSWVRGAGLLYRCPVWTAQNCFNI